MGNGQDRAGHWGSLVTIIIYRRSYPIEDSVTLSHFSW